MSKAKVALSSEMDVDKLLRKLKINTRIKILLQLTA